MKSPPITLREADPLEALEGVKLKDAEPLNKTQLAELAEDLAVQHKTLGKESEASSEGVKPVTLDQTCVGRVSRIDAITHQQVSKAAQRLRTQRLGQTAQALQRIERQEYGDCLKCEEPIAYKRLKARPESPLCLRCQTMRER